jgi:hypothetical protein
MIKEQSHCYPIMNGWVQMAMKAIGFHFSV